MVMRIVDWGVEGERREFGGWIREFYFLDCGAAAGAAG